MHECKTVTLRTRPLKKGMLSYYLDYYPGYRDKETMKVIRHEARYLCLCQTKEQTGAGFQRRYGRESGGGTLPPF